MNTNNLAPCFFLSAAPATGQRRTEQGLCAGRAKTGGVVALSGQGWRKPSYTWPKHKQAGTLFAGLTRYELVGKPLASRSTFDQIKAKGGTGLAKAGPVPINVEINNLTIRVGHSMHSNSAVAE